MRAALPRSLWIIVYTLLMTIYSSLRTVYFGLRNDPDNVDRETVRWSRRLLNVLAVNYTIDNPHHVTLTPGRPYILMSNHASLYDIPLSFLIFPNCRLRMIAKKQLFRIPIFGQGLQAGGFISIDRDNLQQALQDLENAREKMTHGTVIWIAPEGTRSPEGKLQRFKKGGFMLALKTGATIIPVGIQGSSKVLPKNTLHFSLGEQITLRIGEPVDASQYKVEQRNQLVHLVRERIAAALAINE